jgi:AcrR family transcriptional regulator
MRRRLRRGGLSGAGSSAAPWLAIPNQNKYSNSDVGRYGAHGRRSGRPGPGGRLEVGRQTGRRSHTMTTFDQAALLRSDGIRAPQQRRSEATFERLLDAAETMMANRGVDDMSIAAVAAVARSSVGALYARFPDKVALVRAVQVRQLQRQFGAVEAMLGADDDRAGVPLGDLIDRFIRTLVHGMGAQAGLIRAIIVHAVRDEVMRERARLTIEEATRALAALLHRHPEDVAHPDADLAADVVVRMVTGTLQQLILLDRPLDEARLSAELTRAATAYLEYGG